MSRYALLSMIYMMAVLVLFDRLHNSRLWNRCLLSSDDVNRLLKIWSACNDA